MTKVFISYQRQPSAMLAQLIPCKLDDQNLNFFVDTGDPRGGTFTDQIVKNIQSSDVFVCLLAKTTLESPDVRNEIAHAATARKRMIPVFQEGFDSTAAPDDAAVKALLNHNGLGVDDVRNEYVDQSLNLLRQRIREAVGEQAANQPLRRLTLGSHRVLKIDPPVAIPPKANEPPRGTMEVWLTGNVNKFNSNAFRGAIAGMVIGVQAESIVIRKVQSGSVHVTLELPWQSAMQFYFRAVGQWLTVPTGFTPTRRQPCPTCRRMRWFIGGALAVLLVALAVWFYQTGIPLSSLFPQSPQSVDVQETATATRTRTPTRTPSPTRRPPVTATPRRVQSGQSVPAVSASNTPTSTNTPSVTPTDTVPPPPPPPTVPPITSFAAGYSPSDFFYDSNLGRYLVPQFTTVNFYATQYDNICRVMWVVWERDPDKVVEEMNIYNAPFDYSFQFGSVRSYDVWAYPFTCDPGNPNYAAGDSPFYFVVPTG